MSQFIGTSMARGFAGELTRGYYDNTTEVKANDASAPVSAFGVAVKATATGVAALASASDAIYGFAVRVYGQADCDGEQPQAVVTVLKRGYIAVKVLGGTPAFNGAVYVTANGGITADSSAGTAIANAFFMGSVDAEGLAEIAYNI